MATPVLTHDLAIRMADFIDATPQDDRKQWAHSYYSKNCIP